MHASLYTISNMTDTHLEIHPIQVGILRVLLFRPEARFSELNTAKIPNDHFTFHLKTLLDSGLIKKGEDGLYTLTESGKEFANRFDTEASMPVIERQAKIGALVVCVDDSGPERKYLVQKRLKQPFYGFYGFVTGKIKWGETVEEAAIRELDEETGLSADLKLLAVKHKMDYTPEGKILEDKYFFAFLAEHPKGELIYSFEGGENGWFTEEEINNLPDLFDGVRESIEASKNKSLTFLENKFTVSKY